MAAATLQVRRTGSVLSVEPVRGRRSVRPTAGCETNTDGSRDHRTPQRQAQATGWSRSRQCGCRTRGCLRTTLHSRLHSISLRPSDSAIAELASGRRSSATQFGPDKSNHYRPEVRRGYRLPVGSGGCGPVRLYGDRELCQPQHRPDGALRRASQAAFKATGVTIQKGDMVRRLSVTEKLELAVPLLRWRPADEGNGRVGALRAPKAITRRTGPRERAGLLNGPRWPFCIRSADDRCRGCLRGRRVALVRAARPVFLPEHVLQALAGP